MWKKVKISLNHLSIRWKLIALVLVLFVSMAFGIMFLVNRYSTDFYTKLQKQYNEAVMQEMSAQLDTVSSSIDTLYRTFNSQRLFTSETANGETVFQTIQNQIQFERLVSEVINANNLQDLILGTLFYLTDDCYYYIGRGSVADGWKANEMEWYQAFIESGGKSMLYGPVTEDFKTEATKKYECLYYIAPYGNFSIGKDNSFLMFSINMEELLDLAESNPVRQSPLMIINHSQEILHTVDISKEEAEAFLQVFEEKAEGNSKSLSYFDGNYYLCAYFQENFDWWIVFIDEGESFFSELYGVYRNLIIMLTCFAIMGICMAALMINHVMMPLTTLNEFIDIMQTNPEAFIMTDSNTEMGRIGGRLNEMKRKIQTMNKEMYQLQIQEREAQMSALQAQINPHFIYNTLDNIYCMAQLEETQPIMLLSEHLSQMMRYSLSMKQKVVPLELELEHIRSYITILNIRFDNKIQLVNEIDENLNTHDVLKLSLQPLVENAWKHGLSLQDEEGIILLSAKKSMEKLELCIENSGKLISDERCREINKKLETFQYGEANYQESHGISLENINNRLKLTYGPAYGLQLGVRAEGGCIVTIKMPLDKKWAERNLKVQNN